MSENQMMWVIIAITPLALWMTVPSYIEAIQGGEHPSIQRSR